MKKATVTVFITMFITICLSMLGYKVWAVGRTDDGYMIYDAQKDVDNKVDNAEEIEYFDDLSVGDQIINITKRNTLYQAPFAKKNIAYYCIQYSQKMQYAAFTNYKVSGVYDIIGKEIYDKSQGDDKSRISIKEYNEKVVAKFAYILSKNLGHGQDYNPVKGTIDELDEDVRTNENHASCTTSTQELVWHYFNTISGILGKTWGDANNTITNWEELNYGSVVEHENGGKDTVINDSYGNYKEDRNIRDS